MASGDADPLWREDERRVASLQHLRRGAYVGEAARPGLRRPDRDLSGSACLARCGVYEESFVLEQRGDRPPIANDECVL